MFDAPFPLCGHKAPLKYHKKYKATCTKCKSFWDLEAIAAGVDYDQSYPRVRSHYSPSVGASKIKTLQSWLKTLDINLFLLTVCEVGFGGGQCLIFLQDVSKKAYGIEAIKENIDYVASCGVNRDRLFFADALPHELPAKVDLWLFQDSFEHLPDPGKFMNWVFRNSSERACLLIVSPEADSLSERILGRYWPHKLSDHVFHWSKKGIIGLVSQKGFVIEKIFKPIKYVTLITVIMHLIHKIRFLKNFENFFQQFSALDLRFRFNIGEMGLLFRKRP